MRVATAARGSLERVDDHERPESLTIVEILGVQTVASSRDRGLHYHRIPERQPRLRLQVNRRSEQPARVLDHGPSQILRENLEGLGALNSSCRAASEMATTAGCFSRRSTETA